MLKEIMLSDDARLIYVDVSLFELLLVNITHDVFLFALLSLKITKNANIATRYI